VAPPIGQIGFLLHPVDPADAALQAGKASNQYMAEKLARY
jgi:hypothetical protein